MKKNIATAWVKIFFFSSITIIAALFLAWSQGFRFVSERSMPRGIYKIVGEAVEVNEPVIIKLPKYWSDYALARNYVPSNKNKTAERNAVKWLVAKEGDRVAIDAEGISVNGEILPMTKQLLQDSQGREMPSLIMAGRVLEAGEYIVVSHLHAKGFDSRYYGIISQSHIVSKARVILTPSHNGKTMKQSRF